MCMYLITKLQNTWRKKDLKRKRDKSKAIVGEFYILPQVMYRTGTLKVSKVEENKRHYQCNLIYIYRILQKL